ncbi:MAG: hypothetical protein H0X37_00105 [Herpetosiphonaceae bacterium]|nr:hypothetical protein [Herpetosiphonaceae bacterium]
MPGLACGISIAGMSVTVSCDDARLASALRERYHTFPLTARYTFVVQVHLSGATTVSGGSSLLDSELIFRQGVLHLVGSSFAGVIDVQNATAELTLTSPQPLEDVEYFLRNVYALLTFRAGGLLFHAAGIVRDHRGYLFFGQSGSGKTTVARLSLHDLVLNDDLVVLMPTAEGWILHATPFWNPTQVRPTGPACAPLTALFRLVQARTVYAKPMDAGQALAEFVSSVPVVAGDAQLVNLLLARGHSLLRTIPMYALHFLPDASFWNTVEAVT